MDARGYPIRSSRLAAVGSAWHMAETCEALVIVVDAHRQITRSCALKTSAWVCCL